jgi:hypothetical protein
VGFAEKNSLFMADGWVSLEKTALLWPMTCPRPSNHPDGDLQAIKI